MSTGLQKIEVLKQTVLSSKEVFNSRLCDKSITFEAEAGFAIQALSASDYAMNIALNNKQSVIDAVTNIAAIGISLNPAKKQAYLVPRKDKICLDISYMGLIDLAIACGAIKWAQAAVVYENDSFELRGYDAPPVHGFSPFSSARGKPIGVYCVVKTPDSEYLTHSMPISDVFAIRDRSEAYKAGKSSPWKTDEGEMIKKTCVKQASKYWGSGKDRLLEAIQYLNVENGEGLAPIVNRPSRNPNTPAAASVTDVEKLEGLIDMLENAAKSGTEHFKTVWKALQESDKALVGIPQRDRIKALADSYQDKVIEGEFKTESEAQHG